MPHTAGRYEVVRYPSASEGVLTACCSCRFKEHVVAVKWLAWLLRKRRKDPQLISQMGYIQLIIGDTAAAALSFRQA